MARNQDEETRGKDSKGKEVAGNSRGITRPPLNFLAILNYYSIPFDTSCPDKLCRQLYAGVDLKPNEPNRLVSSLSDQRKVLWRPECLSFIFILTLIKFKISVMILFVQFYLFRNFCYFSQFFVTFFFYLDWLEQY